MKYVNIHQAKTHLSRLLKDVEAGEEVMIQRNGKPIAQLVPIREAKLPRQPGMWAGQVEIKPEFNVPMSDEELASFYGDAGQGSIQKTPG
jgi:prevent-host-death family protein